METETPQPPVSDSQPPEQSPLNDALATAQADAAAARETATAAVSTLRDVLISANPGVPASLISGETPEALMASLDQAKAIRDEILAAHQPPAEQPAAQPPRGGSPAAPSLPADASPMELIRFGIAHRAAR